MLARDHAVMNTASNGIAVNDLSAPATDATIDPVPDHFSQASLVVTRVIVVCPTCQATLSVRRVYVGSAVKCKQCGQIFTVPADAEDDPLSTVDRSAGAHFGRSPQGDGDALLQRAETPDKTLLRQLEQVIAASNDLRAAHDRLQAEHNQLKAKQDEVGAQLKSVTDDLNAIRGDQATIAATDVRSPAPEQEVSALVQVLRDENRNWPTKLSDRESVINGLEKRVEAFELAEQSHLDERQRLTSELAALRARHHELLEEHKATEVLCKQLEAGNHELKTALARRESEYDAMLHAERAERQQLGEEVLALRANAEETARVAEQLFAANMNGPDAAFASAYSLEAARAQADQLKDKLDEANALYRALAETLHGIGVPIDVPFRCRDRAETGY